MTFIRVGECNKCGKCCRGCPLLDRGKRLCTMHDTETYREMYSECAEWPTEPSDLEKKGVVDVCSYRFSEVC